MVVIDSDSSSNMDASTDSNQGSKTSSSHDQEEIPDVNTEGEEDTEGSSTEGVRCFDAEKGVNSLDDVTTIDFKEKSIEDIMKYHFLDLGVAFVFYNWYASTHGFGARKDRVVKNINGDRIQQTFVCYRQGLCVEKKFPSTPKTCVRRNRTRCGCDAMCRVHIDDISGRWYIKVIRNDHNHALLDEQFVGMLPAHRKMTNYDIWRFKHMRHVGIKTNQIFGLFASEAGGFQKVGFRRKDMYNLHERQRLTSSTDAQAACEFLESLCLSDDPMFWRHMVDDEGRLTHLFWCDGAAQRDLRIFGDVIAFDATYKRNKYMCPLVIFSGVNHHNKTIVFCAAIVCDETEQTYVWLLNQLSAAMGGKSPTSVITDGDMSMRNAISRVFPECHHRLCAWHLMRNANRNIPGNPQFVRKFRQCMLGDFEVADFEARWERMLIEFGLENNKWIKEVYEKRHMWATAHVRGKFFAGFRTTSTCEGLHCQFGKYVKYQNNLLEFSQQFMRCLKYLRFSELEADFGSVNGEPVLDSPFPFIESVAAKMYTRSVFLFFQTVLRRACTCKVVKCREISSCYLYTVTKYTKGVQWEVSFSPSTLNFNCSCERFESLGIACEHIIVVLVYLNIVTLPDCLILKRWTKSAKDSINLATPSKDLSRDPTKISQFTNLVERCKRMLVADVNCSQPGLVRATIDIIDAQTKALEDACAKENPAYVYNGTFSENTILNPKRVRTKGCGASASASQTKGQSSGRKTKSCGNCKRPGHNRTSCPLLSQYANDRGFDVDCGDIDVDMDMN